MAYPREVRDHAHDLYVISGLTYDEVAEETGVSLSQIKEWGSLGNWGKEKEDEESSYQQRRALIRAAIHLQAQNAAKGDANALRTYAEIERLEQQRHAQRKSTSRSILNEQLAFFALRHPEIFEQFSGIFVEFLDEANPEVLRLKSWERKELRDKIQATVGRVGTLATKKNFDPDTLRKIREEVYGIVDTSH